MPTIILNFRKLRMIVLATRWFWLGVLLKETSVTDGRSEELTDNIHRALQNRIFTYATTT